tara:strand:- start:117 stop:287 length:171 start_codon:yes stop_codon:yes gene_type:complete
MENPPPGLEWNILGFASAAVLPVIPAKVATIRGRTNSLVIIEIDKKRDPVGSLVYM